MGILDVNPVDPSDNVPGLRTLGYSALKALPGSATLDLIGVPVAALNFNSQLIHNLATPVVDTDAANKSYVDVATTKIQSAVVHIAGSETITGLKDFSSGITVRSIHPVLPRGIWNSVSQYYAGDIVQYSGSSYYAVNNNINKAPPTSASNWQLFSGGFSYRAAWQASTLYSPYDVVTYNSTAYVSLTTFTSGLTFDPANWNLFVGPITLGTANPTTISPTSVLNPGTSSIPSHEDHSHALSGVVSLTGATMSGELIAPDVGVTGINSLNPSRLVGATPSAPPVVGTFNVGDYIIDDSATPTAWIYTVGGTWAKAGDKLFVHSTGTETVQGAKTFASEVTAPDLKASGINSLLPGRFVGEISGATPTSGSFQTGDFVVDQATPNVWINATPNTPGGWKPALPPSGTYAALNTTNTYTSKQFVEGSFVVGKNVWVDVSHPVWGVDMTGVNDSTVGFQAACDSCYSTADPSTTTRVATARLFIPPGILKIQTWKLRSVMGMHVMGCGPQVTKVRFTGGAAAAADGVIRGCDWNGVAHCVFEMFTVEGDGTEGLGEAISVYWDNVTNSPTKAARSTTQNTFRNITMANCKTKTAFRLGRDGDSNQVDNATIDHVSLIGGWTGQAETTWWQDGLVVGHGTSGNNVDHTAYFMTVATYRRNLHMRASQIGVLSCDFANGEDDIYFETGTSYFSARNCRSENSMHFMRGGGPSTSATFITLEDVDWHGPLAATDGFQLNLVGATSGSFVLVSPTGERTAAIPSNSLAPAVDSAIAALASVAGTSNVTVTCITDAGASARVSQSVAYVTLLNGVANAGWTLDASLLVGGTPTLTPVNHWIEHKYGGVLNLRNARVISQPAGIIPQIYTAPSVPLVITYDGLAPGTTVANAFNTSNTSITGRGFCVIDSHGVQVSVVDGVLMINGSLGAAGRGTDPDTSLSRGSAGIWTTTRLHASDGLATKLKAGAFSDTDFVGALNALTNMALFGINDTTGQIEYRRANGTWGVIGTITNQVVSNYQMIRERGGQHLGGTSSGTRVMLQGSAAPQNPTTSTAGTGAFWFDPADYAIGGFSTKLRLRFTILTNDVDPGSDFTITMRAVTAASGASGINAITLGSTVTGSTLTITDVTAAADNFYHAEAEFDPPTAGLYVITFLNGSVMPAAATLVVKVDISYRLL